MSISLQFNPYIADYIGLNEAIVLQSIQEALLSEAAIYGQDGNRWITYSYSQWQECFPFWSAKTIYRALQTLEKHGVLISRIVTHSHKHKHYKYYALNQTCSDLLKVSRSLKSAERGAPSDDSGKGSFTANTLNTPNKKGDEHGQDALNRQDNLGSVDRLGVSRGQSVQDTLGGADNLEAVSRQVVLSKRDNFSSASSSLKAQKQAQPPGFAENNSHLSIGLDNLGVPDSLGAADNLSSSSYIKKIFPSFKALSEGKKETKKEMVKKEDLELLRREGDQKKSKSDIYQKMVEVWNEAVQTRLFGAENPILLNAERAKKLKHLLEALLESDFEQWKAYCTYIRNSPFLLGKGVRGFKATFDWAINPSNVIKIRGGHFFDTEAGYRKDSATQSAIVSTPYSGLEASSGQLNADDLTSLKQHCALQNFPDEWCDVCLHLIHTLGKQVYQNWFHQMTPLELTARTIRLGVASIFLRDWILNHYETALRRALKHVLSVNEDFTIEVMHKTHSP